MVSEVSRPEEFPCSIEVERTLFVTEYVIETEDVLYPKENLWIEWNYGKWITDKDTVRVSKINSLQNGFLLREHVHSLFDQYLVSVNPDDNYKIVVFDVDLDGMDGWTLDPVCCDEADPHFGSQSYSDLMDSYSVQNSQSTAAAHIIINKTIVQRPDTEQNEVRLSSRKKALQ
ncbi:uncharacterized protein LAJ45_04083 [Morchella importuna]|uniref:uncharacterized protein n=1 Tax=Morchella importuna TaxID=1174673 RepID=UPI001E8E5560|nr:uncharacterized protein LAJ45_04083 [Morchella importuna]KAH8152089.1 hypothetical protein LAJ45_04083 [Morchella importuna]